MKMIKMLTAPEDRVSAFFIFLRCSSVNFRHLGPHEGVGSRAGAALNSLVMFTFQC